jgi:hypothetical protein
MDDYNKELNDWLKKFAIVVVVSLALSFAIGFVFHLSSTDRGVLSAGLSSLVISWVFRKKRQRSPRK